MSVRWLRLVLLLVPFCLAAAPLPAPPPAPPSVPLVPAAMPAASRPDPVALAPDEAERVLALLKDDAQRTAFANQLEALIDARKATQAAAPPTPVGLVGSVLVELADTVAAVSDGLGNLAVALTAMPALAGQMAARLGDPAELQRWVAVLWKLGAVLAGGLLAERAAKLALRPLSRRVDRWHASGWAGRASTLALIAVIEALSVGGFAWVAYVVLALVEPDFITRLTALALINAFVLARLILIAAKVALAPKNDDARLLPIGAGAATFLWVWVRRLVSVPVYGTFLIQALYLLGLSYPAFALLQRVLGLVVVALAVRFVLKSRAPVRAWLHRRTGEESVAVPAAWRQFGRRVADVWHVVMIVYLIAAYFVWSVGIAGGFQYLLRVTFLSVLLLVASRAVALGLERAIAYGVLVAEEMAQEAPLVQAQANRYLPLIRGVVRGFLTLATGLLLLQVWGIDTVAWIGSEAGRRLLSMVITLMVVAALATLVWEVVSALIERFLTETDARGNPLPRSPRVRTLLPLLRNALLIVEIIVVALVVLSELGINIQPLLAGAGVVGLAIGFGAQTLVRDVITGLFILFEDAIRIGDVVEVSGKSGVVEALNIRSIKLRDLRGNLLTVPFSAVSTVLNMTKDYSFAVFDVAIDIGRSVDAVVAALAAIDAEIRADPELAAMMLAPLEVMGIDRFEGGQVVVRARVKTLAGKQWSISRAFNQRIEARLTEAGVWRPPPAMVTIPAFSMDGVPPATMPISPPAVAPVAARAD